MKKTLTIKKKKKKKEKEEEEEEIRPTFISKKEKKILPYTKKLLTLKNIEMRQINGKQMKNKCIIIQK